MAVLRRIYTEVRGARLFGRVGVLAYRDLRSGQPLILEREPHNQRDRNAVIAKTLTGEPVGYIARETAAVLAPQMDCGIMWQCKARARPRPGRWLPAVVWREGETTADKTVRARTLENAA